MLKKIIKFFSGSLRAKLLVILIIFNVSILVLLSSTLYWRSSTILIDKEKEKNKLELHQLIRNIDKLTSDLDISTKELIYSPTVQDALKEVNLKHDLDLDRKRILDSALSKMIINHSDIVYSINLYTNTGMFFYEGPSLIWLKSSDFSELVQSSFYKEIMAGDGKMVVGPYDPATGTYVIGRTVKLMDDLSRFGILIMHVRFSAVQAYYKEIDTTMNSKILLFDQTQTMMGSNSGLPVTFSDFDQKRELSINNAKYLISSETVPSTNWKLIKLTSFQSILESTQVMKQATFLIIAVYFTFFILLSIFISKWLSRPLNLLTKLMKKSLEERFLIKFPFDGTDEIGQLSRSYNQMMDEINELINKEYRLNLLNKEMELSALQAQINPHFIYNTLDTINWASRVNGMVEVAQLSESLGRLLRVSFRNEDKNYCIKDEMEYVSSYLAIQKYRFEERIQITLEVDPSVLDIPIPKLVVQPLLENAIVHNVDQSDFPISISMYIHADDDRTHVVVNVRDNGGGIPDEYMDLLHRAGSDPHQHYPHGMLNVHRRLMLNYGANYGLQVTTSPDGTAISFRVPIDNTGGTQYGI